MRPAAFLSKYIQTSRAVTTLVTSQFSLHIQMPNAFKAQFDISVL